MPFDPTKTPGFYGIRCLILAVGILVTPTAAYAQNAGYSGAATNNATAPTALNTANMLTLGTPAAGNIGTPNNLNQNQLQAQPVNMAASGMVTNNSSGIVLPSPPPATAFSNDPNQLATQAQLAAQAEQAAMEAQAKAEADQAKREQEHNLKSYNKASAGLLPMSPDQIREFMHKLEQSQDASVPPYAGQPKTEVRITTLSMDPGVEPPQVNLSSGYVTTINMVDASGEPWPILDVGVGGNFEVSPTQAGTHVVRIMPLTRVGNGNLSVLLKDLPTPVIFRLSAGGPTVDLRYDARIGKMGPGAKAPLIDRPRLEAGNETLMLLLENVPPAAAKRLKVAGMDGRTLAWTLDNHTYVRTPLTLLSPAWDSSVSSADGMTVYEIGDAPVLLMSDNGAVVRARLLRDEDHDK